MIKGAINDNTMITGQINNNGTITGEIKGTGSIKGKTNYASYNGTSDYNGLRNKPQINSVTLTGNKRLDELGVEALTNSEIENLINNQI